VSITKAWPLVDERIVSAIALDEVIRPRNPSLVGLTGSAYRDVGTDHLNDKLIVVLPIAERGAVQVQAGSVAHQQQDVILARAATRRIVAIAAQNAVVASVV
jgi:hypothetical protein